MKVWAYTRVSTDGQVGDDKFGLEAQKRQITDFCEKNGHQIMKWFTDEGESGAKERPGFDKIVYSEVEYDVDAIVVAKSDRVARDICVYYFYKMMLRKKNISLISVMEDFGSYGIFSSILEAFTICVGEMERDNIRKRTSSGRYVKAANGGFGGGRPMLGYDIVNGELVVNEAEAVVVRRLFELKESNTYEKTAEILNEEGYLTKRGNKWNVPSVQSVCKNKELYYGRYIYGNMLESVKGRHEAILE